MNLDHRARARRKIWRVFISFSMQIECFIMPIFQYPVVSPFSRLLLKHMPTISLFITHNVGFLRTLPRFVTSPFPRSQSNLTLDIFWTSREQRMIESCPTMPSSRDKNAYCTPIASISLFPEWSLYRMYCHLIYRIITTGRVAVAWRYFIFGFYAP